MSHRRSMSIAGALVIVAFALPAASASARLIDPVNLSGTEVRLRTIRGGTPSSTPAAPTSAPDQQAPSPVVNARGTDVAAPDQQAPSPVVNARGTDVAAVDQQAPSPGDDLGFPAGRPDRRGRRLAWTPSRSWRWSCSRSAASRPGSR